MKTSLEYKQVTRAMALARAEMPAIVMDADNPYFKSRYASLGAILATIQPFLDKYELSIISVPEGDGVNVGITTRVSHFESGEWVEATVLVPLKGASDKTQIVQVAGIDFSYLRRYTINALFNLYAEEDTDGNLGYEKPPKQVSRPVVKASRNNPAKVGAKAVKETKVEEPVSKLSEYLEEFGHKWNKARGLGEEEDNLPKLSAKDAQDEMVVLEKIAELDILLKEAEDNA